MHRQRGVDGIGSVVGGERERQEGRKGRVTSCSVMERGVKDRDWLWQSSNGEAKLRIFCWIL